MKKLLSIILSASVILSSVVLTANAAVTERVLQDFDNAQTGDISLNYNEQLGGFPLADNVVLASDCWTFNSIVENQYGQTGKSLKVHSTKLFSTSQAKANYTAPVLLNLPKDLAPTDAWGASCNIYVPKLQDNIRLRVRGRIEGDTVLDGIASFGSDGKIRDVKGNVAETALQLQEGWNHVGLFNDTANIRFCVNGYSFAKYMPTYPSTGWKNTYMELRFETEDGSTDADIDVWYLLDDFEITNTPVINSNTNYAFSSAENQIISDMSDAKTVDEAIASLGLSSYITAQAVRIDENGNTVALDGMDKISNATHIIERSSSGAKRLYKLTFTGIIEPPEDSATAGFEVDNKNRAIGKVVKFTKVGTLKEKLNQYSSGNVTIVTEQGNEAADDMLVNSTTKVLFTDSHYQGLMYTIGTKQCTFVESDNSLSDGTQVTASGNANSVPGIKNIWGDGTVNTNIKLYKTTVGGTSGYKFEYDGKGSNAHNIGVRTDINAMGIDVMKQGSKTIVETTVRPETIGWYGMNFRWFNDAQNKSISDNGVYVAGQAHKTTGITFADDGKIYLGGNGDIANTKGCKQWMDLLGDYEAGKEYKIQLVIKTPNVEDKVFYIEGIYINGEKCGTYNNDGYLTSHLNYTHGGGYSRLAEVDLTFFAADNAADKSYAVSMGNVVCYSADNFTLDKYIPSNIILPAAEYYANDMVANGKTVKAAQKTVADFLTGLQSDVSIYVTDKNGVISSANDKLTDGMKLCVASLDGRISGDSYTYSSLTDYGKTSISESDTNVTYTKTIQHYSDNSDSMRLLAASYDDNGILIECKMSDEKVLSGYTSETFTASLNKAGAENVKLFIWDGETLKPYIEVIDVSNGIISNGNATNF
mgnify:CR=1 FL=1